MRRGSPAWWPGGAACNDAGFADIEAMLAERGWAAVDLPDASVVLRTRDWLLAQLRETLPDLPRLEDYHSAVANDARHFAVFDDIANRFWQARLGCAIVAQNLDLFRRLLGPDLLVQQYPYLRIVRPGQADDAVPLHRDTYYGASPYEVSVVVPFTDMGPDCAVRAVSGSHVEPDFGIPLRSRAKHRGDHRVAAAQARLCLRAAPARSRIGGACRADAGETRPGADLRPFAGAWRRRQLFRPHAVLHRHPGGECARARAIGPRRPQGLLRPALLLADQPLGGALPHAERARWRASGRALR